MIKLYWLILFLFLAAACFPGCDGPDAAPEALVYPEISVRSMTFDTLCTSEVSDPGYFVIHNRFAETLVLPYIGLNDGDGSDFALTVDGIASNSLENVEIPPYDSIYVFVGVRLHPLGVDFPVMLHDSIEILSASGMDYVTLRAWGQDVIAVEGDIRQDEHWTANRPYLVTGDLKVDSGAVLNIDAGTRVFFKSGTGLFVRGQLLVNGDACCPVLFTSIRQHGIFRTMPGQWNGIVLYSGSQDNQINYATIANAVTGLQVGSVEYDGKASVVLNGMKIMQMSRTGVLALASDIEASNCLITRCGYYAVALLSGGDYNFGQVTIANYRSGAGLAGTTKHSYPALQITNYVSLGKEGHESVSYRGKGNVLFRNSIITGDRLSGNELEIDQIGDHSVSYCFDHCLIQLADTFNTDNAREYIRLLKGVDPVFKNPFGTHDFSLDSLSPAIHAGSLSAYGREQIDLRGTSRAEAVRPDLGAYEYEAEH